MQSEFCIFAACPRGCFVVFGIIAYWQCAAVPGAVVCHVVYLNSREHSEYIWCFTLGS